MNTLRDRIAQRITAIASSGLGDLTLGESLVGYFSFTAADNGLSFTVVISEGGNTEICTAVYTHSGTKLVRGAIVKSTASDSRVAFSTKAIVAVGISSFELNDMAVIEQASRATTFDLLASDDGTIIPCTAALTCNLRTTNSLPARFWTELASRTSGVITVVANSGITMIQNGASITSFTTTGEGSSILIRGSGTSNRVYVSKAL